MRRPRLHGVLVPLLLLGLATSTVAQELDRRVERRLEQVEKYLDRVEQLLASAGSAARARRDLEAAQREWQAAASYEGKLDPAHPRVSAIQHRLDAAQQQLAALEETPPDIPPTETPSDGPVDPGVEISRLELTGTEHHLEEFEKIVQRAGGKPIPLGHAGTLALTRVKELCERYPEHPLLEPLFQRARKALLRSKGETMKITPEMLRYRDIPALIMEALGEIRDRSWEELMTRLQASEEPILEPFPPPDPGQVLVDDLVGRYVVLPGVVYPRNEFSYLSTQYLYVGSPSRGYYYVRLSSRAWAGAYEALRRFRRAVSGDLPADLQWTVVGKISGLHFLIPEAGEEKRKNAHLGWIVEPEYILVPEFTLSWYDSQLEEGGTFAGEDQLATIKEALYTVREVPPEATPEQLVEVYETAIKEKNLELFLECIDPLRKQTPRAIQRAGYHWDLHQHRFATEYVMSVVDRVQVRVIRGIDTTDDLEAWFIPEEEREKMKERAGPTVERATIWLKTFDERGRQVRQPHPLYLRRYDGERWLIEEPSWPL